MKLPNKFIKDYKKLFRLFKSGMTFVAFDTETTGLSAENDRIIEIGAVKFNSDGIIQRYNSLIKPSVIIPYHITEITHITNKMVQDSPAIDKIIPEFIDFIDDSTLIGHNVNFDLRFLKAEMERLNLNPVENHVIDTLQLCRWVYPDFEKYNQPFMAEHFKIKIENAHRAYDDAYVCGQIFLHCIKESADRQKL